MGNLDISRYLFDPAKHYIGARQQQRRVVTDADWNEGTSAAAEDDRRGRVAVVGAKGSPDCGFLIKDVVAAESGKAEFSICGGTMYVGGGRHELESDEQFRYQGDWLQQKASDRLDAPTGPRNDLVFLRCWEQLVSSVEDREFAEPFLGPGVQTSGRVRASARVEARTVTATSCEDAWLEAQSMLVPECPQAELSADCELLSPVRMEVGFTDEETDVSQDPCAPCVPGGGAYLSVDNQAIRVKVAADGLRFAWGFDDAAPLYRVRLVGDAVEFVDLPGAVRDFPLAGDTVELLGWSALLENGEKAAQEVGFFAKVTESFSPASSSLQLDSAPPAGGIVQAWPGHPHENSLPGADGLYLYLRVWKRGVDTSAPALLPLTGTQTLGVTGLKLTFSFENGALTGCPGDFWVIAARRNTPEQLVPWGLQEAPIAPHGPRRFFAPLSFVEWHDDPFTGQLAAYPQDCRPRFRALSDRSSCCVYTVAPPESGRQADFESIQAAIDALPPQGGKVCVLPGSYAELVHINQRVGIEIEGCGKQTKIVNPEGQGLVSSSSARALITICDSQFIQIRDFCLRPEGRPGVRLKEGALPAIFGLEQPPPNLAIRLDRLQIQCAPALDESDDNEPVQQRSAIECFAGIDVRVTDSRLAMEASASVFPCVFLTGSTLELSNCEVRADAQAGAGPSPWGGVQIAGGSSGVRIVNNEILGGLGHGITLGSYAYADIADAAFPNNPAVVPVGYGLVDTVEGQVEVSLAARSFETQDEEGSLVAYSLGELHDIVIEGNSISGMKTSGIGAAAFWPLGGDEYGDSIVVRGLRISDNSIVGNMQQVPVLGRTWPREIDKPGAGGISLGTVVRGQIEGNEIRRNGPRQVDPVCGIYVLQSVGLDIRANHILDNGQQRPIFAPVNAGRRGGIVVAVPADATHLDELLTGLELEPSKAVAGPALRVHDNVVDQPEGAALNVLRAFGAVSIANNSLASRGNSQILTDDLSPAISLQLIVESGGSVPQPPYTVGLASEHGAAVHVRNAARSIDTESATEETTKTGGRTVFENNLVLLNWLGDAPGPRLAAVTLDAGYFGDVAVSGNDFRSDMHQPVDPDFPEYFLDAGNGRAKFLLTQVLAFGGSVRFTNNRATEGLFDSFLSGVTFASSISAWSFYNACSHCTLIGGVPLAGATPYAINDHILNEYLCDQQTLTQPSPRQFVAIFLPTPA